MSSAPRANWHEPHLTARAASRMAIGALRARLLPSRAQRGGLMRAWILSLVALSLAIQSFRGVPAAAVPAESSDETIDLLEVSGNGQSGLPGTELPKPLVVKVVDRKGRRVEEQIVNFRVVAGGGSVFAGAAITNENGIAQERWTLGLTGAQRVE